MFSKKILLLFSFCLIFLFSLAACGKRDLLFFQPHKPVVKNFSNGMTLFLLEDHELPTVQMALFIRGGAVYDPPGKEGLSALAMQTIRMGGSVARNPAQVEQDLEFVGASLEMGSSAEYQTASLSCLKKDLSLGSSIFFDLLKAPALDKDRFELIRNNMKEGLRREMEDPLSLAYREYPPFVYGEENPWGRRVTLKSLDAVSWEDVKEFHRHRIHSDRAVLAASGDFSVEELVSKIDSQSWNSRSTEPLPPLLPTPEHFEKNMRLIAKKGLTQTTILVGHLAVQRDNPDKFPLLVMNFILGGGGALTSRLGDEIRTSQGKAYAVWSDFGFGKDLSLFRVVAQTASENTAWVAKKIESMISEMVQKPDFTDEEVVRAQQAILRSLVFNFETKFSQVKEAVRFHLYGYPDNYLEIFQKEISRVTRSDLERVSRKYLHPDGLQVLLVGDEKIIAKDLVELQKMFPLKNPLSL